MAEANARARAAQRLALVIDGLAAPALALSGGVDSLTLGAFLARRRSDVVAYHAVSAAVPSDATARARALCEREGLRLVELDAGELDDERYLQNPVDRCFTCKSHLYDAIAAVVAGAQDSSGVHAVCSGTNVDDLADFRPGLRAAALREVRHPFVEAQLDKRDVRALADELGLGVWAQLPASPCLSSRVETGVRIRPELLRAVDLVESAVRALVPGAVRLRVRKDGPVLELEGQTLGALDTSARESFMALAALALRDAGIVEALRFAPYARGSAFLRVVDG